MHALSKQITKIVFFMILTAIIPISASVNNLSFEEAFQKMRQTNRALSAAKMEKNQRLFERKAARGLFLPKLNVEGRYTKIDESISIDLNDIRSAMILLHSDNPVVSQLLPSFVTPVQDESFMNFSATFTWPVFTGGRIIAANRAAKARLDESREKIRQTEAGLVSELVTRYFSLRLTKEVVKVRKQVLDGMDKHLFEAKKLEEKGMIAKAERLHAEVYHAEAERGYKKALRDMKISQTALNNTISDSGLVEPKSPLFIFQEIEPLSFFLKAAAAQNPILKQIFSKRKVAHQGYTKELATFLPEVYLFGVKELYTDDLTLLEPKWAVGVGFNFNIFEGFSNYHRLKAAKYVEKRVADIEIKAHNDIETLIEKRYNELKNAYEQYESAAKALQFAEEYVRVRTRAFEEGLATSTDVVDAQLALSRVKIDRLIAMYSFDVSLAKLLEAAGRSEQFEEYRTRKDLEVESEN